MAARARPRASMSRAKHSILPRRVLGAAQTPRPAPRDLPPHGVRYLHGRYCVGDDQLWGAVGEHRGGDHTLAALKSIRAARPGGYRPFVIMDNLSANETPAIRRWARREKRGAVLHPGQRVLGQSDRGAIRASPHPRHWRL
jgi:hypothetical protein